MLICFVSRRLEITTSIPIAIGTGDFAELVYFLFGNLFLVLVILLLYKQVS